MSESLLDRWRRRLRGASASTVESRPAPSPDIAPEPPRPETISIDRVAMLSAEFPREFPLAEAAVTRVLEAINGTDLSPLARRSPALLGYGWTAYLQCSVARVVRAQRALGHYVPPGGRVLDFGSYFGNCSLACHAMGFAVDAIDSYATYGSALAPCVDLQREAGVRVLDFAETGYGLQGLGGQYDAVVCAGVIEHIPHTPRLLLETLTSVLKPGGVLVLDTPNLAYLYRRLTLLEGQTIFSPIAQQYYTELPFEGHHREYTVAEVEWILRAVGHELLSLDTFNYSVFGQTELSGDHVTYHREMQADPELREYIIAVSRKSGD